jgi:glycosyltransferase involved in cell wall biosynthesis
VARVYNAVDVVRWSTMAAAPSEAPLRRLGVANRRYVLYVGGFDFRKNTAGMMAGLAHARASGVDVELVWAGHLETKHIAGIESAARDAGVSPAVRLVGLVSDQDLALLYSQAVAHLFVSRLEGFGLTVVEAMACGCPVLTTNRGALAEVAGDAALTVDPDDFAGIGAGIARLVGEPALRADLVSRGRLRAPRFSRAAHADAMAEVYLRFLAGRVAVPSD